MNGPQIALLVAWALVIIGIVGWWKTSLRK
jgi:hypothetical protein